MEKSYEINKKNLKKWRGGNPGDARRRRRRQNEIIIQARIIRNDPPP